MIMETISSNENLKSPQIQLPLWKSGIGFANSTRQFSLAHLVNTIFDFFMLSTLEETAPQHFFE